MKKALTIIALVSVIGINAQKLEKIKGNKIVTLSERIFEQIVTLDLQKNINLVLQTSSTNKLEIHADENLHDIVKSDLIDGKLSIYLANRIGSKKKFELTLYLTDISKIVLNQNSKLTNYDYINATNLTLILNDKSEANVFFKSDSLNVKMNDFTKGNMSLQGMRVDYKFEGNSRATINCQFENTTIKTAQKSNVTLNGKSEILTITADDQSKVKASNLIVNTSKINLEDTAIIYVNVSDNLIISAINKSKVYIYGNPKIELPTFKDSASLFKRL